MTVVRRPGSRAMLVGLCLLASGCDRVAKWRHPELASCQRFIRSRMRAPGSFDRTWYMVTDLAVSRPLLADAIGGADGATMARTAPDPAIRDVFVQYDGADATGQRVRAAASCYFALVDDRAGRYARDRESAVDAAIRENEARTLMASMGKEGVVAADCCLAQGFDLKRLADMRHIRRGRVSAAAGAKER